MVVNLPAKKDTKETPPSREIRPGELSCRPSVATGSTLGGANNIPPQDRSRDDFPQGSQGYDSEQRRHTFPFDPPKREEHAKVTRSTSAGLPSLQEEKRKFNLGNGQINNYLCFYHF